jgi:hypothetical protein
LPTAFQELRRKLWSRAFGRRSWARRYGAFREREREGLVERPSYAYGVLRAADVARYFGHRAVTVVEFGVASGAGLLNLAGLAEQVRAETGVEFRVVGFDTGAGLPVVRGHKDHPELWSPGDFQMESREALLARIAGRAELVFGDVAETVPGFVAGLDPAAPLAFVSVDVDLYTGSKDALRCLLGRPEQYCPAVSMYFDDVGFFFANEWCGELASIREFNEENEHRKIGADRSLPGGRDPFGSWHRCMYVAHVLDHPDRTTPRPRSQLTIDAHHELMSSAFLY